MADYLKSAFNYFTQSPLGKTENDFVGNCVKVGSLTLRIRRMIAEGGFGIVYETQDVNSGKSYALKRMTSSDNTTQAIIVHEIKLLKQLSGHPNIMKYHEASLMKSKQKSIFEFRIVCELCKGGQLTQYLPTPRYESPLPLNVILPIMHQTCRAVQHMHNQSPSVIHRDLKIENLLLSENFIIKLCDFGSAGTVTHSPDSSWTALQRLTVQEELEKYTTPMYRAPEMLDLYQNYPIGTAADVWALGCILFLLTCTYHPFEDSAKLAILNAKYNLPSNSSDHTTLYNLIRQILLVDPRQRPDVTTVLGELSEIASMREVRVSGSIPLSAQMHHKPQISSIPPTTTDRTTAAPAGPTTTTTLTNPMADSSILDPGMSSSQTSQHSPKPPKRPDRPPGVGVPSRPAPPPPVTNKTISTHLPSHPTTNQSTTASNSAGMGGGNMLGLIKGGAGNLFRNIRQVSNRMLETVSATMTSEQDFQWITSRIAVMPHPTESSIESMNAGITMEDVQTMLNTQHPNAYAVYNLSSKPYRSSHWFDGRVSHRPFDSHRAPCLRTLIELCLNARLWLQQNSTNVCIVHCVDGKASSAMFVCSLLCFCHLFDNTSPALQLFSARRGNPKLNASQLRYLDYVAQLVHNAVPTPHHRSLQLIRLVVSPIPTFNKTKNGCRPYIEIYEGQSRILSTFTDYESLRSYVLEDNEIEFVLNGVPVMGDLTVIVYHCRSPMAGRSKVGSVKIAQFQLYTGFVEPTHTELIYFKSDLDHLDTSGGGFGGFTSRYAESFHLTLEFMVSPTKKQRQGNDPNEFPWENLPPTKSLQPYLCVSNKLELKAILDDFGRFNHKPHKVTSDDSGPEAWNGLFTASQSVPGDASQTAVASRADEDAVPLDGGKPPHQMHGVKSQTSRKLDQNKVAEEHTPVADLLGFHNPTAEDPVILESEQSTFDDKTTFVDNLFDLDATKHVESSTDWASVFDIGAQTTSTTTTESNIRDSVCANPFHLFGMHTYEDTQQPAACHKDPPSATTIHPDVDWMFNRVHLSTSASVTNLHSNKSAEPLHPSVSYTSLNTNKIGGDPTGSENSRSSTADPFADLSGLFSKTPNKSKTSKTATSSNHSPPSADQPRTVPTTATSSTVKTPPHTFPSASTTFGQHHSSWSNFSTTTTNSTNKPQFHTSPAHTNARPQGAGKHDFSDLLGDFGASTPADDQPKTVNQIRREKLAKHTDPQQLRVQDWAHGKDRNLRALLCSLPAILWEGVRWKPVGITDLMNPDQVKRQYRNAARAIHPDKWMNTENENLARMIFVELNDAMAEFEKESASSTVTF